VPEVPAVPGPSPGQHAGTSGSTEAMGKNGGRWMLEFCVAQLVERGVVNERG